MSFFSSLWNRNTRQQPTPTINPVIQQRQERSNKVMTSCYLDLHDSDTVNLLTLLKPMHQIDFLILINVHSSLIKDESIIKKIQLSHPHIHPPLCTFKKEIPRTLIFSKFNIIETIPCPKTPTIFARKTEFECQIIRVGIEEIYPSASIGFVVFNLDSKVNDKENIVEDYVPVTPFFIKQYELNLIGKLESTMNIPNYRRSAVLYFGNFHETTVVDEPITLGTFDQSTLDTIINNLIEHKETIIDGTSMIEQLEKHQIPVKKALGIIYSKCEEFIALRAAIIAEAVAISMSDYIHSSVRLLPYKDIARQYIDESVLGLNTACKLWGYYNEHIDKNEPQTAAYLNRINKSLSEMNLPIEIENTEINFAMFLTAIQRWLHLKMKSPILISLLSGRELRDITANDFLFTTEVCFPNFSSSKLKESQRINGNLLGLCYGNFLNHMGSLVESNSDCALTIQKDLHILNMTNFQSSDYTSKSPFASVQCLQYSLIPQSLQLPPSVDGLFVRFAIYPQIQ
ncbi:hypothetical protein EHI8A_088100 [Entamoeba histolytica HM-1:IMSS-B]|uniref:Uncharacterized protein n=6 Tax=Entamoeba histolytica TaxID=5759 RepID=C4LUF9_ENTH1|nr:hypothetical protein EHI_049580 [Entamoeba histolytica HM-1:IMSS]EMH72262.1 hypothetical protein EHI8A_088100 [Entamoeba histolytica HM-1:IMSS-B]EMS14238.1 hypothetical protein KM1_155260 [Entamoeba histolytica HM-3:IMSS]ENY62216.1 hypothetical protein EHI7A_084510 [Entamoeba histolytica HM-1:IMSS-A]GAT92245.1 hypothetical protein CL6EHI_049580 [Entamoeba histolytica]EAL50498.1 hypothetical protein EHI_049580 [Entamoeba histolytica HM-1:IMSS]|eukprot:XP_655884.1 hypothetical protein EHI_049580 [Entamoeba histolytica HM-1:IMSS]